MNRLQYSKELELLAGCRFYIKLTLMGSPEALTGVGFYIEYNRARLGRQGGKVDKEEEQRRIKTD